jgi:hypothetical protein
MSWPQEDFIQDSSLTAVSVFLFTEPNTRKPNSLRDWNLELKGKAHVATIITDWKKFLHHEHCGLSSWSPPITIARLFRNFFWRLWCRSFSVCIVRPANRMSWDCVDYTVTKLWAKWYWVRILTGVIYIHLLQKRPDQLWGLHCLLWNWQREILSWD